MAKTCQLYREQRRKYKVRIRNRCMALSGLIPGVRKASW